MNALARVFALFVSLALVPVPSGPSTQQVAGAIPSTPPSTGFRIGPVSGLTTQWYPAPPKTAIPLGTVAQFKLTAPAGRTVVWNGAQEITRTATASIAECLVNQVGTHTITAKVKLPKGLIIKQVCNLDVIDTQATPIIMSPIQAWVDPVNLNASSTNEETMAVYFGGSIAALTNVGPDQYGTSVNRPVHMSVQVTPAGFLPLIEWNIAGIPEGIGGTFTRSWKGINTHVVSAGPSTNPALSQIETYRVKISAPSGAFLGNYPITFTATTTPTGYENEVTWISSTKFGTTTPVIGTGPSFTAQFNNAWGPDPEIALPFKWVGVKADNAEFGGDATNVNKSQQQDEQPPCTAETCAIDCHECEEPSSVDPVYLFSGEFYESVEDIQIKGRWLDFVWARKYRSRVGRNTVQGNGWDFSFNIGIEVRNNHILLFDGNARVDIYSPSGTGAWTKAESFRELTQNPDGSYTLTFRDTGTWQFHADDGSSTAGRVKAIIDRNGNAVTLDYDTQGRLTTIHDTLDTAAHNRDITVSYNGDGFIESVTDFVGRQVVYEYYQDVDPGGSFGDLKSVTSPAVTGTPTGNDFPSGKTTVYTYSEGFANEDQNHNLLTITDPKGQIYLTNTYGTSPLRSIEFDRVTRQIWGIPGDIIDIVYTAQVPSQQNNFAVVKAVVNDRVGNVREHIFDLFNRGVIYREHTGRADPDQPTDIDAGLNLPVNPLRTDDPPFFETRWEYNADGLETRVVYPNFNEEVSVYDESNPDRRSQGNLQQQCLIAGALGGDQTQICESFEYDDGFGGCCGSNFVTRHVDGGGNETLHTYDSFGNRLHTQHRIPSIVEDWEYNQFGQMAAHILPANGNGHRRRDEYTYDTSGPQLGYLREKSVDATGLSLATDHQYDAVGNQVRLIDPRGNDTQYVYNELDQVVREFSREVTSGGSVRYERDTYFDANDNLVRVDIHNVDGQGTLQPNTHFTTIYEYETLNNVVRSCEEVGDYTGPIPGAPELPTCVGLPQADFITTEYEYDENRNPTLIRLGEATNGNQPANLIRMVYDERNLLFRTIRADGDPDESTMQIDFDGNGNVNKIHQGLEAVAPSTPHITIVDYDGYNRVTMSTDSMGNVTAFHYDENNNRVSARVDGELQDGQGSAGNLRLSEEFFSFDEMDRLVRKETEFFDTHPPQTPLQGGQLLGKSIETTVWADDSQMKSVVNDNLHAVDYAFDTANRRSTVTDAKANLVTYLYDANSNKIAVIESEKFDLGGPDDVFTTTNVYDGLDRVTSMTDNVGNTHAYFYDSRNNQSTTIDALGNVVQYRHDGINRPISTTMTLTDTGTGNGNVIGQLVTSQAWDDSSRLVSITDDGPHTTSYAYDALNRRIVTTYSDCTQYSVVFDVHHNQVSMVDPNGSQISCSYDLLDRLTNKTIIPAIIVPGHVSNDTTFENYEFDGLSRMVSIVDDDSLIVREYDSLSHIVIEILNGQTTSSVYDGVGNQLSVGYPGGRTIQATYDELERKKTIIDVGVGETLATYEFVGPDRVERRTYANGTVTSYAYDGITGVPNAPDDFGVKQIVRTSHVFAPGGPQMILDDRSYTWDPLYNKTQRSDLRIGGPQLTHDYNYDSVYRLSRTIVTNRSSAVLRNERYTLDGIGNRKMVTGGLRPGSYTCDGTLCEPADCQMNQYTRTSFDSREYDRNGNLLVIDSDLTAQKEVHYDYRNQVVEVVDIGSGQRDEYAYDSLGRRISRTVDASGAATKTLYFYDHWRVCEEQNGIDFTLATYIYGRAIDEVLTMRRGGVDYFYHSDDLGSVMAVSSTSGTAAERYDYQDFGEPEFFDGADNSVVGSAIGNPYLFTARRFDPETSWYYYRSRYLDPLAGRFTSRDPLGIWGDLPNMGNGTTYVANNPATLIDPMGTAAAPSFQPPIPGAEPPIPGLDCPPVGGHWGPNALHDYWFEALGAYAAVALFVHFEVYAWLFPGHEG